MKSQHLLLHYIKSHWYFYGLAIMLLCLANIVQAYYPRLLGELTDHLQQGNMGQPVLLHYSLLLLAIGLGFGVLGAAGQYIIMHLGRRFEFFTRKRLFDHLSGLSESYYFKHSVGGLLSYFMNDVTSVREAISKGINQTVNSLILILSAVAMMLFSSIPFYLIAVCVLPLALIPWIVLRIKPLVRSRSLAVQEALATMTAAAEEQIGGIRVTKTFAAEPVMVSRFEDTVDSIRHNQVRLIRLSSLFQAMIPFVGAVSLVVTIGFGGYLTVRRHISLGDFVALTLYMRMMVNPLQQIGNVINTMQRSQASMERVNGLLAATPDIRQEEPPAQADLTRADIHIRNLSFAYPDSGEVLHNLRLVIKQGQTIGILGKTGSGKTTLMKLLLRICDPPPGTIFAGETDIRRLPLESLRRQIAYVPQDGFLFSSSIRSNIAFFDRSSPLERVERASRQADIYHSIMGFPHRFDTRLGERGVTLSGGQRQRTSLARGLIKEAPLLILDDSVSAVDSVTERRIIDAVGKRRQGLTTIIVAHRISALRHADEIIVLDEGRIAERGTHDQLLEQSGIYAKLYAIQEGSGGYAGEGE